MIACADVQHQTVQFEIATQMHTMNALLAIAFQTEAPPPLMLTPPQIANKGAALENLISPLEPEPEDDSDPGDGGAAVKEDTDDKEDAVDMTDDG